MVGKHAAARDLGDKLEQSPAIQELLRDEITRHLRDKFAGYEIPKKFIFLSEDFTLENGMLTQTMKLKRHVVTERYRREIEALFAQV